MNHIDYLTYHAYEGLRPLDLDYVTSELYEDGEEIPHDIVDLIDWANRRADYMNEHTEDGMFMGKIPSWI